MGYWAEKNAIQKSLHNPACLSYGVILAAFWQKQHALNSRQVATIATCPFDPYRQIQLVMPNISKPAVARNIKSARIVNIGPPFAIKQELAGEPSSSCLDFLTSCRVRVWMVSLRHHPSSCILTP
jgi:hypothetical protein